MTTRNCERARTVSSAGAWHVALVRVLNGLAPLRSLASRCSPSSCSPDKLVLRFKRKVEEDPLDISRINSQVWCGGAVVTEDDVQQLADDGVTADIDCRLEFNDVSLVGAFNNLPPTPNSLKNHPQIAYCFAGVADDGLPKPVSWFQTGWDFAKPILDNGGVVLSHCAAGVNRGPSVAYFLLRAHWGMTGDNAFALLKAQRPVVNIAYRADADKAIVALELGS